MSRWPAHGDLGRRTAWLPVLVALALVVVLFMSVGMSQAHAQTCPPDPPETCETTTTSTSTTSTTSTTIDYSERTWNETQNMRAEILVGMGLALFVGGLTFTYRLWSPS